MTFPNTYHNDKWLFTFSNLPNMSDITDMKYFQNYIKSIIIPEYNIGEIQSVGVFGFQIRHPIAGMKQNTELGNIQIEFKVSENFVNYMYAFKWLKDLRYGNLDNGRYTDLIRRYVIKNGILSILDNQKRTIANISFTNMMLLNLSSLNLLMGSSDEITFTLTFSYEEILYTEVNPLIGSSNPQTPSIISPCGISGIPYNSVSASWEM